MEKADIDKQRGKAQNLEVFSYVQSSHFRLPAQHLCAPSCLTGQQPHPHLHGDVRKDLTCELHSAAILLPPPWSHHRAKQKSQHSLGMLPSCSVFSAADGLECRKARAEARGARAALFSSLAQWNNSCPWWLASSRTQPRDGEPLNFTCNWGGWGRENPTPGWGRVFFAGAGGGGGGPPPAPPFWGGGGGGCGQEEMALKQKHARC